MEVNEAIVQGKRRNIPDSTIKVKIGDTWHSQSIDGGHYTVQTFLERLDMIDGVTFAFNQLTNKIQIVCTGETEISEPLARVLGLPSKIEQGSFISAEPIDLDKKPWMIKANFIKNSAINASYTRLSSYSDG